MESMREVGAVRDVVLPRRGGNAPGGRAAGARRSALCLLRWVGGDLDAQPYQDRQRQSTLKRVQRQRPRHSE